MRTEAIGSVVEAVKSWNPHAASNRPITYLDLSSVDNRTKLIVEPTIVDSSEAPSRARQLVSTGDVLVSTVRPNLNAVAWVPPEFDGATASTGFCVLRPREEDVDSRYLFHWVQTRTFVSDMERLATGASYPAVSDKIVHGSAIPLPPIEEQRRIASILDATDALRAKRRQALEKLDSLTQSIFIDMFGDPISNDRSWPERSLREVCQRIQIGPFGSLLHQSDYEEGGIPIVNPMHIVDGTIRPRSDQTVQVKKYAELGNYQLRQGDVVLGRRGEMGRCAVVGPEEDGWLCGSGSLFLRPDTSYMTSTFLASALSSPRGRDRLERLAQGVTMLNLNSDMVESFVLGVPPVDSQARYVAATNHWSELATSFRQSLFQLDALFASLQHRAFRGEL